MNVRDARATRGTRNWGRAAEAYALRVQAETRPEQELAHARAKADLYDDGPAGSGADGGDSASSGTASTPTPAPTTAVHPGASHNRHGGAL